MSEISKDQREAQDAQVLALMSVIKHLPAKDQKFAKDLCDQQQAKGRLSDTQWYWVNELFNRATGTATPKPMDDVGGFDAVIKLFKTAQKHLKFPKIKLVVDDRPLELTVAGPNASRPGTVNVTDGRPFGQNTWYGRVSVEGKFEHGRASDEACAEVASFLKKFGADPAGTAKEYGKLSGKCCFCNSALTDERSTAAGFGPTCAKHYGLEAEWKAAAGVLDSMKEAA